MKVCGEWVQVVQLTLLYYYEHCYLSETCSTSVGKKVVNAPQKRKTAVIKDLNN